MLGLTRHITVVRDVTARAALEPRAFTNALRWLLLVTRRAVPCRHCLRCSGGGCSGRSPSAFALRGGGGRGRGRRHGCGGCRRRVLQGVQRQMQSEQHRARRAGLQLLRGERFELRLRHRWQVGVQSGEMGDAVLQSGAGFGRRSEVSAVVQSAEC
jgi:hypothetical protein